MIPPPPPFMAEDEERMGGAGTGCMLAREWEYISE